MAKTALDGLLRKSVTKIGWVLDPEGQDSLWLSVKPEKEEETEKELLKSQIKNLGSVELGLDDGVVRKNHILVVFFNDLEAGKASCPEFFERARAQIELAKAAQ